LNEQRGIPRQSLIEQYLSGDPRAGASLHEYVLQLIEKALLSLEAKGSRFRNREDVKQEILTAILVNDNAAVLSNFKGDSRLSTYLWSVIRFKLIDALRKEMGIAERYEPLSENIVDDPTPSSELPGLLDRFLNQCSEKDAFILRLRWLEELDYDTICREVSARNFQVDKTYIGNLLFRKRKELLSFLKNKGYPIDIQK